MNKKTKYVVAQGIIWSGSLLGLAVTFTAMGSRNGFIMIPVLLCGATISLIIQAKSIPNTSSDTA